MKESRAARNSSLSGVVAADGVSDVDFWSSLTASAPPEFILRSRVSGGLEFRQRIVVSVEGAERSCGGGVACYRRLQGK